VTCAIALAQTIITSVTWLLGYLFQCVKCGVVGAGYSSDDDLGLKVSRGFFGVRALPIS
jgi:hypothetical protein